MKSLRDALSYSSIKGICVFDRAHILTKEAFNALLKTFREAPKGTYLT